MMAVVFRDGNITASRKTIFSLMIALAGSMRLKVVFLINMQLENQHIQSFIELYQKKYGVLLESQEAMEMATKIARLVEIVELNSENNER